jgi:hypothetical protein
VQGQFLHPKEICNPLAAAVQAIQGRRIGTLALIVSRRDPLAKNCHKDRVPLPRQPSRSSAASEQFVVRVGSNHQYIHNAIRS